MESNSHQASERERWSPVFVDLGRSTWSLPSSSQRCWRQSSPSWPRDTSAPETGMTRGPYRPRDWKLHINTTHPHRGLTRTNTKFNPLTPWLTTSVSQLLTKHLNSVNKSVGNICMQKSRQKSCQHFSSDCNRKYNRCRPSIYYEHAFWTFLRPSPLLTGTPLGDPYPFEDISSI